MRRLDLVAGLAVGGELGLAVLAEAGGVEDRPVFDVDGVVAGVLLRLAHGRGGEGDDQVVGVDAVAPLLHLLEAARAVALELDADLGADRDREAVDVELVLDAGGLHVDAAAVVFLHDPLGHRRAHRVVVAAEQHRVGVGGQARQPLKCSTQIRVKSRRAVAMSVSTLPVEPLEQDARALVVDAAPAHVDRLDLRRRQPLHRVEVALADLEVVLDHLVEGGEREVELADRLAGLGRELEDQPSLADREVQPVGAGRRPGGRRAAAGAKRFSSSRSKIATRRSCSISGVGGARPVSSSVTSIRRSVAVGASGMASPLVQTVEPRADREAVRLEALGAGEASRRPGRWRRAPPASSGRWWCAS